MLQHYPRPLRVRGRNQRPKALDQQQHLDKGKICKARLEKQKLIEESLRIQIY